MTDDRVPHRRRPLEVRHAQRIIDLIAVPYNETTEVLRRGRWVTESVDPGRVHRGPRRRHRQPGPRPRRTRSARSWRSTRTTREGYGPNCGSPAPSPATTSSSSPPTACCRRRSGSSRSLEEWTPDRSAVKVTKAKLVHIALTGDPAYKGAKVLAVRTADAAPPGRRHRTSTGSGWRCLPPPHGMELPSGPT